MDRYGGSEQSRLLAPSDGLSARQLFALLQHLPRTTVANRPTRADLHSLPLSPETSTPVQNLTKNIDSVSRPPLICPLVPGQPGPNFPQLCRYCKTPGHDISACRKLAYKNAQSQPAENAQDDSAVLGTSRGATFTTRLIPTP